MAFRVGQKIVCIRYDPYNIDTGGIEVCPRKDDIVEIIAIKSMGWLTLKGFPDYIEYESYNYRPLDKSFVNEVCEMIMEDDLIEVIPNFIPGKLT